MEIRSVSLRRREVQTAAVFVENGRGIRVLHWDGAVKTRHLTPGEVAVLLQPLLELPVGKRKLRPFFAGSGWRLDVQYADGTVLRRPVNDCLSHIWSCLAREPV